MLLIDENTKTIFLHNPGCGGTFVKESYLNAHPGYPRRMLAMKGPEAYIDAVVLPRYVPDYREYKLLAFVRNPYERFLFALRDGAGENGMLKQLCDRHSGDPKEVCRELLGYDYGTQDAFLRSSLCPRLVPQSRFRARGAELLRYESQQDWKYLFNILSIPLDAVDIVCGDHPDDEIKTMIKELYFDDEEIFSMYE